MRGVWTVPLRVVHMATIAMALHVFCHPRVAQNSGR
jgi:hypothetical protein